MGGDSWAAQGMKSHEIVGGDGETTLELTFTLGPCMPGARPRRSRSPGHCAMAKRTF